MSDAPVAPRPGAGPGPEADSAPEAKPAAKSPQTASAFTAYKVMAWVTGTFLILLCVEMVLKYVLQINGPGQDVIGSWIATVHGWIYVVYAVTCLNLWSKARWSFGRLVLMILGGVIPVLSFVVEARAAHWPVIKRRPRPTTLSG